MLLTLWLHGNRKLKQEAWVWANAYSCQNYQNYVMDGYHFGYESRKLQVREWTVLTAKFSRFGDTFKSVIGWYTQSLKYLISQIKLSLGFVFLFLLLIF